MGGPLNGILSALSAHPGAAFLVAACDLPFLSEEALRVLVASRDPSKPMTVFENPARENFPEPLCAVYEPSYLDEARAAMARGATCPTKIAQALDAKRLPLRGPEEALFLENANTPEDYKKAVAGKASSDGGRGMEDGGEGKATVEYFAVFRAQAKRASEEVSLDGSSLADLYERLRDRHGFALERASVLVAINDAYASWDAMPRPGDRLAFIPPVSGG
jgi:molybdopterin-guanine dinucleotide biosynthesis protein A